MTRTSISLHWGFSSCLLVWEPGRSTAHRWRPGQTPAASPPLGSSVGGRNNVEIMTNTTLCCWQEKIVGFWIDLATTGNTGTATVLQYERWIPDEELEVVFVLKFRKSTKNTLLCYVKEKLTFCMTVWIFPISHMWSFFPLGIPGTSGSDWVSMQPFQTLQHN